MAGDRQQMVSSKLLGGLAAFAILFGVFSLGPRIWARGQLNLFARDLVRVWTVDTLIPNENVCLPADVDRSQRMAKALSRAGDADPNRLLHQGELACIQGDRAAAKQLWGKAIRQIPSDPLASLFAALVSFADGHILPSSYQKAIANYGIRQGKEQEHRGALSAAIDWYEFSFAYAPSGTTAGKLAALYRQLGQDASVEDVWHRLQTTFSANSSEYWWAVGQMAEQQEDWEVAANAYRKAADLATGTDAFKYLLREGLMWQRARDFERAKVAYRKAIDHAPDKMDGYLGMGHIYRKQKQYDQAISWYEKAIELAPNHHAAYYYLGIIARAQGDYEKALDYFNKALARRSGYALAYYQKALTLDKMGERKAAIDALEEAIKRSKSPPQSWRDLLDLWRAYPWYPSVPFDQTEPLRLECQAFIDAMVTRRPPLTHGESGLRVATCASGRTTVVGYQRRACTTAHRRS